MIGEAHSQPRPAPEVQHGWVPSPGVALLSFSFEDSRLDLGWPLDEENVFLCTASRKHLPLLPSLGRLVTVLHFTPLSVLFLLRSLPHPCLFLGSEVGHWAEDQLRGLGGKLTAFL